MTEKTKKEMRADWVSALRSGEYAQCVGMLADERAGRVGFCCLGVAATMIGRVVRENGKYIKDDYPDDIYQGNEDIYNDIKTHFGIKDKHKFIRMNDEDRYTFNQIADFIENAPEGTFRD